MLNWIILTVERAFPSRTKRRRVLNSIVKPVARAIGFSGPAQRLAFPSFERPVVSILIVTFNKAEYTFQCLETVKAYSDVPYELIIVDNGSADGTKSLLERIENATVIRNSGNAGFLRACNQGAQTARGEFILFLNNDTQVAPNWLRGGLEGGKGGPPSGGG